MKEAYIKILCLACFLSVLFCSSAALASDDMRFYVEAEFGGSFSDFDSGGQNNGGGTPFPNTGDDSDETALAGIRFGAKLSENFRADIGFSHRGNLDFTTNSFQSQALKYYYNTDIEDIYTLMFSVYYEPVQYRNFIPYLGAGIGSTWAKISTSDSRKGSNIKMVEGSRDTAIFSWQAEAGIQYALTQTLTLKLGYRYIDLGNFEARLRGASDPVGVPEGKYRGELTANEVIFGVRYSF